MTVWKFIEKNFEKWFLIISLVAMVLITFMQVVLRWLDAATVWAEELSRYIMLYQVWIGASYAVREDAHIRITVSSPVISAGCPKRWYWHFGSSSHCGSLWRASCWSRRSPSWVRCPPPCASP